MMEKWIYSIAAALGIVVLLAVCLVPERGSKGRHRRVPAQKPDPMEH